MATLARIQVAGFDAKRASIASVIMAAGAVAIVAITAAFAVTQFRQVASTEDIMAIPGMTFAAFTLCNTLRVLAYIPQIAKAIRDQSGAEAISLWTWGLFLAGHMSAMAYAVENKEDWTMASMFLGNALGCIAILVIAAWKRSLRRKRQIEELHT
jgi:hypothetical protein